MSTRQEVLAALRRAGDTGVSGEGLAHHLGVSRVAVAKHVAGLRALGYAIDGEPGTGYRLVSAPDLALPDEVALLVNSPLWTRFEGGPETGSTNADACALARKGAAEGTVVVAARQTAGRGRLGREWASPAGGAYVSAVLRPSVAPAEAGPLSLVVGLGIARGLEALEVVAGLKWPNDLLFEGRKLAGVLLEMSAEADRVEWVVAGFGINVRNHDAVFVDKGNAPPAAAAISQIVPGLRVAEVAAAALDGVAAAYAEWAGAGLAGMLADYEARSVLTGNEVTVSDALGNVRASGMCEGIDAQGCLLVRDPDGLHAIAAGEVTLRTRAY